MRVKKIEEASEKQPVTRETPVARKEDWYRPRLKRLRVSLDTASAAGSGSDGGGRATAFQ